MSRDTGSGTIKKFDPENMRIAIGILLLCALELDMPGGKPPRLPANVTKKLLPGNGLKHCQLAIPVFSWNNLSAYSYTSNLTFYRVGYGFSFSTTACTLSIIIHLLHWL